MMVASAIVCGSLLYFGMPKRRGWNCEGEDQSTCRPDQSVKMSGRGRQPAMKNTTFLPFPFNGMP